MATIYRRQYAQQTNQKNAFSPQLHLNPSNRIFNNFLNKVTTNAQSQNPPKVFIRRVKMGSRQGIKTKTDISRCKSSENNRHNTEIAIKSQSLHKSKSTKSFVIRKKKYRSFHRAKDEPIQTKDSIEVEFNELKEVIMKQINENTKQIQQQFQSTKLVNQPMHQQTNRNAFLLQNTITYSNSKKINLALLQTKKSIHFQKEQPTQKKAKVILENQPQEIHKKQICNKQNIAECFPNTNSNKLKQQNQKSLKRFDRKQKVHSACKIVKMPWDQAKSSNQGLKKVRGQFRKDYDQGSFLKGAKQQHLRFGDISMIGAQNSLLGSGHLQSLKNLCIELQIK